MDMDIFQAEMKAMQSETPEIQKSLGTGILPVMAVTGEIMLEVLDEMIDEAYLMVRDTATGLWSLSKPLRNTTHYKKVAKFTNNKVIKPTKNAAIKGWQVVAPLGEKGMNYTKGGIKNTKNAWKYTAPKIGETAGHFKNAALNGWHFAAPKAVDSYNFVIPHAKNATIAGWEIIKPLPGKTLNLTIGAWNYIAPKASNVVQPAIKFVGDQIARGYNYVASAFDLGFDDIEIDFSDLTDEQLMNYGSYSSYDTYEAAQEEVEAEEIQAMIQAATQ